MYRSCVFYIEALAVSILLSGTVCGAVGPNPTLESCQDVDGTIIEQSENSVSSAENADYVGFCASHANRDLLYQAICKHTKTPSVCFQPAVMDFLEVDGELYNESTAKWNVQRLRPLETILARKRISTESCSSINEFFHPVASQFHLGINRKFKAATEQVRMSQCQLERGQKPCNCSVHKDPLAELQQSSRDIFCWRDIEKEDRFYHYLYNAIIDRQKNLACTKRSIPPLKIGLSVLPKTIPERASALNKLLKGGHQVQISTKAPHSIVISNYRVTCRNGAKVLEYQVLDSLYGSPTSSSSKPIDWVSANGFNIGGLGPGLLGKIDDNVPAMWLEERAPGEPLPKIQYPNF